MAEKNTHTKSADAPTEGNAPQLKRAEFIDRVTALTGAKKKDAKPLIEATLAVLGDAIAAQEDINLPPLGKLKVQKRKSLDKADLLHCRLRRPHTMVKPAAAQGSEVDTEGNEKTGDIPLATGGVRV